MMASLLAKRMFSSKLLNARPAYKFPRAPPSGLFLATTVFKRAFTGGSDYIPTTFPVYEATKTDFGTHSANGGLKKLLVEGLVKLINDIPFGFPPKDAERRRQAFQRTVQLLEDIARRRQAERRRAQTNSDAAQMEEVPHRQVGNAEDTQRGEQEETSTGEMPSVPDTEDARAQRLREYFQRSLQPNPAEPPTEQTNNSTEETDRTGQAANDQRPVFESDDSSLDFAIYQPSKLVKVGIRSISMLMARKMDASSAPNLDGESVFGLSSINTSTSKEGDTVFRFAKRKREDSGLRSDSEDDAEPTSEPCAKRAHIDDGKTQVYDSESDSDLDSNAADSGSSPEWSPTHSDTDQEFYDLVFGAFKRTRQDTVPLSDSEGNVEPISRPRMGKERTEDGSGTVDGDETVQSENPFLNGLVSNGVKTFLGLNGPEVDCEEGDLKEQDQGVDVNGGDDWDE